MKKIFIIIALISFSVILSGCNNLNLNNSDSQLEENTNDNSKDIISRSSENKDTKHEIVENEIARFSTPLTSGNPNRIVNIKLTSNKINGYILKNGETFSFNQIVGPCTAEEGYLKSEIFVNKKIEYALGGGNCQVSTTLYNACLQVSGITITERHEHGRDVDYIEDGKDATVSYNTLDFAFKNDTGYDIKLFTSCDDKNVYASINKIERK